MKRFLILILLGAGVIAVAYLLWSWPGPGSRAEVRPVPRGDREIAWIHTATSGAAWERFVAGARLAQQLHPELRLTVEDQNAFPEQTAAVSELALRAGDSNARLWIRWYKQTSEASAAYWVKELAARDPAPLAVIGGSTSDRALELARALNEQPAWHGDRPVFLITTATADRVAARPDSQTHFEDLMRVYPDRTFRFCFTNSQMAEAVVDFVWTSGHFGEPGLSLSAASSLAGGLGAQAPLRSLGLFAAGLRPMFASVFTVEWEDDPFSLDLSQQFRSQLRARQAVLEQTYRVPFSVGDYHRPNPPEAALVEELLGELPRVDRRPLLVLPASLRPARRFLRTLAAAAPLEVRRLVVLTGDSISFNSIYRDRDIAWHVQDIPVPLVLFCHENPVLHPPEKSGPNGLTPNNSTDELLLNAVITRIVATACFKSGDPGRVEPAAGANELSANLRACRLPEAGVPFFDAAGNRRGGSGEHVVCLLPQRLGGRVLPAATLEVWMRQAHNGKPQWRIVKSLHLSYADNAAGGGPADAEP